MKPWITLSTAEGPDGAPLTLQQRGDEYVIRIRGQVLMGSRTHGSEEAMAAVLEPKPGQRVLVGGLGLGFTLRAVLDRVGPDARVTVAELLPAVVAWNRGPVASLAGAPLDDPRVEVFEGDVRKKVKAAPESFDAVLLDVDNGPSAMTQTGNQALYDEAGVALFHRALKPRGMFVTWSAAEDARFVRRLEDAGFAVQARKVGSHGRGGAQHVLFLARRR